MVTEVSRQYDIEAALPPDTDDSSWYATWIRESRDQDVSV